MCTNMQRIAIALLAVAFVQGRVPTGKEVSDPRYDAVLDLYSTTDHKLVGSLRFKWWTMMDVVSVRVDQPFNFTSKYGQVYANLYRSEDVMPQCVTVGNALVDSMRDEINIDDGEVLQLASDPTNDPYLLKASLLRGGKNSILDRVGVMYAMKQENDEHSAIACGRIRYAHSTDYFLRDLYSKRTLPPVPGKTETNAVPVSEYVKSTATESIINSTPAPPLVQADSESSSTPVPINSTETPNPEPEAAEFSRDVKANSPSASTETNAVPVSKASNSSTVPTDDEVHPPPEQAGSESSSTPVPINSTETPKLEAEDATPTTLPKTAKTIERSATLRLVSTRSFYDKTTGLFFPYDGNAVVTVLGLPPFGVTEGTVVAVLYRSEDVGPDCVATGPAIAVHDAKFNATRPATVYMKSFSPQNEHDPHEYVLSCALVSPNSDCDIIGRDVIVYVIERASSTFWDDFLKPTSPHIPLSCGTIELREDTEFNKARTPSSVSYPHINHLSDFQHYRDI